MEAATPLAAPGAARVRRPPRRWWYGVPPLVLAASMALAAGLWGYAAQSVERGDAARRHGDFALAHAAYQRELVLARAPLIGWLVEQSTRHAAAGRTRNDLQWSEALARQGRFAEARARLNAVLSTSASAADRARARQAMAGILIRWSAELEGQHAYLTAIERLREAAVFDTEGSQHAVVQEALARASLAEAASLESDKNYREAVRWYRDVLHDFDGTDAATQARTALPHALYQQALADVDAGIYERAREAMQEVVSRFADAPDAERARAALAAPQPLTGRTVNADHAPVPNLQVRVITKWRMVRPGFYDDTLGPVYQGASDDQGRFSISLPPGDNYLVTWWSPSRNTFITTFTPDFTDPINKVSVLPLQPATAGDLPVS